MAAIAPRRSRGGERREEEPPLTREKENPCSRSHARNSERGAAAQRALRSVSEVVAKYGKPDLNSELSRGRPVNSELSRCRSAAVLPS